MIFKRITKMVLIALLIALVVSVFGEYFFFSHEISILKKECQRQREEIEGYQKIVQEINSRTPLAEENLTRLIQVTPKIRELALSMSTGDPLKDLERYTLWVHDHIRYNYDSEYPYIIAGKVYFKPDVWAPSKVTFARGYGDCEDMAILLASMFAATHPRYDVYIIVISLGNISHAAVLVPKVKAIADPTYGSVFAGRNFLFSWMSAIHAPQSSYVRFVVGFKEEKPYYMMFSSNSAFLSWLQREYGV